MNILCYSTTDWDAPQFGSRQQIMLRLSRTHKVLFVEPQLGLHHATRSRGTHGVRDLNPNLRILGTGYALPFRFHRAGQWINDALLQQRLKSQLSWFDGLPDVFWTYWPSSSHLVGRFGEKLSVYHCIDNYSVSGYPMTSSTTILNVERQLLASADLTITSSPHLQEKCRPWARDCHYIPAGVDYELFKDSNGGSLETGAIGFMGTLDGRIDLDLISSIARHFPHRRILLHGAVKSHKVDLAALEPLENVEIRGAYLPSQAPGLMRELAVGIVPYKCTEFTKGIVPLKVFEYLAAGLPVVSTDLPGLKEESQLVKLAESIETFLESLEEVFSSGNDKSVVMQRKGEASAHSWDKVAKRIEALVLERLPS